VHVVRGCLYKSPTSPLRAHPPPPRLPPPPAGPHMHVIAPRSASPIPPHSPLRAAYILSSSPDALITTLAIVSLCALHTRLCSRHLPLLVLRKGWLGRCTVCCGSRRPRTRAGAGHRQDLIRDPVWGDGHDSRAISPIICAIIADARADHAP